MHVIDNILYLNYRKELIAYAFTQGPIAAISLVDWRPGYPKQISFPSPELAQAVLGQLKHYLSTH